MIICRHTGKEGGKHGNYDSDKIRDLLCLYISFCKPVSLSDNKSILTDLEVATNPIT